jgi:hypothetical protein
MATYFAPKLLQVAERQDAAPKLTDASGIDWRRLTDTNLDWLERTLQNAMLGAVADEERLGLACLFLFHLRAMLAGGPTEDLRPDLFLTEGGF